jgi:hypothetical protein
MIRFVLPGYATTFTGHAAGSNDAVDNMRMPEAGRAVWMYRRQEPPLDRRGGYPSIQGWRAFDRASLLGSSA